MKCPHCLKVKIEWEELIMRWIDGKERLIQRVACDDCYAKAGVCVVD